MKRERREKKRRDYVRRKRVLQKIVPHLHGGHFSYPGLPGRVHALPLRAPRSGIFPRPLRMADEHFQHLFHPGKAPGCNDHGTARHPHHPSVDLRSCRGLHSAACLHGTPPSASFPPGNRRRLLGNLHGGHLLLPGDQPPGSPEGERLRMDRRGLCLSPGDSFSPGGLVCLFRYARGLLSAGRGSGGRHCRRGRTPSSGPEGGRGK